MICHEFKVRNRHELARRGDRRSALHRRRARAGELRRAQRAADRRRARRQVHAGRQREAQDQGSIIIVIATDAPLLPQQLKRLARRASLGLARNGSYSGDGSGDLFIAFSTANAAVNQEEAYDMRALANSQLNPLFLATVQSVEESVVNALVAAEAMTG